MSHSPLFLNRCIPAARPHVSSKSSETTTLTQNSTIQVFFSLAGNALVQATDVLQNDLSGQGQFHFGTLKKPVNGVGDITVDGDQPDGINEGVIFGGIFQEDSADGCISLEP